MLALLAALVLAQAPTPILLAPLDASAMAPASVALLERGLRDAFKDGAWALVNAEERDASAAHARDAGTVIKGAPALLTCNAIPVGPRALFQCRLASVVDQRVLWNGRKACEPDAFACARALGLEARTYLDAHPPSYQAR